MFNVFGISDKGRYRTENQDCFDARAMADGLMVMVCDGMGGAAAGRVASAMARERFMEFFKTVLESHDGTAVTDILSQSVDAANRRVYNHAERYEEYAGMGTTIVAGYMLDDVAYFVNVGDSRAYRIARDGIVQVTKDHSLVQNMIDEGLLTADEARRHPRRNMITRAVGAERFVDSDVYSIAVRPGDSFLLCSDGLYNAIDDAELHRLVLAAGDVQTACSTLVKTAIEPGTRDNVTAVVISDRKGDA